MIFVLSSHCFSFLIICVCVLFCCSQAPSSILESLEAHMNSLEGKKGYEITELILNHFKWQRGSNSAIVNQMLHARFDRKT